MNNEAYLANEFRRYFPDAADITVEFSEDETITVSILYPNDPDHERTVNWLMEIGSDDSWYTFRPLVALSYEDVLTIPFSGEEG